MFPCFYFYFFFQPQCLCYHTCHFRFHTLAISLVILSSSDTQETQNRSLFSTNHVLMSRLETFTSPLSESSFLLPKPVAPLPCALSSAPLLPPFSLLCFSPSPPLNQFTPWGQMDLAKAYGRHYSVSPCCLQNPNS